MVRVDVSKAAEGGDYKDVKRGKYLVESDDYSVFEHSEESKHPDSSFWSLHWNIEKDPQHDGEFEGQKVFGRVALPCDVCAEEGDTADGHADEDYEPYDLYNILRATLGQHRFTEEDLQSGEIDVEPEDLLGLRCWVQYSKQKGSDYMQIKKYRPLDDDSDEDRDLLP